MRDLVWCPPAVLCEGLKTATCALESRGEQRHALDSGELATAGQQGPMAWPQRFLAPWPSSHPPGQTQRVAPVAAGLVVERP